MRAGTKEINEKIFQLADDPQTLIRLKQSELLRDKIIVTMTGSLLILRSRYERPPLTRMTNKNGRYLRQESYEENDCRGFFGEVRKLLRRYDPFETSHLCSAALGFRLMTVTKAFGMTLHTSDD